MSEHPTTQPSAGPTTQPVPEPTTQPVLEPTTQPVPEPPSGPTPEPSPARAAEAPATGVVADAPIDRLENTSERDLDAILERGDDVHRTLQERLRDLDT